MKIAVASTGLGHVSRGVEAWAKALAEGLDSQGAGVRRQTSGNTSSSSEDVEVTLFSAGEIDTDHASSLVNVVVPCLRRNDKLVRLWVKLAPGFTWRWGWKAGYSIEQKSFAKYMISYLKSGQYDLVHTQDPVLALELEAARKRGDIKTPVILAHGTADSPEFLSDITYMQHLCLDYREKWVEGQACEKKDDYWISEKGKYQFCIPNFIDVERFCPRELLQEGREEGFNYDPAFALRGYGGRGTREIHGKDLVNLDSSSTTDQNLPNDVIEKDRSKSFGEKSSSADPSFAQGFGGQVNTDLREKLGIPKDAFVIGCSAALQFNHKRLDYLIEEIATFSKHPNPDTLTLPYLLLAGASTAETPQVERLAKDLLGDKCIVLKNLPFNEMPEFFRTLDLYVHPAHDEFYGISILEAMSSGVPVIAHSSPSLSEQVFISKYMNVNVPPAGLSVDMKKEGSVAEFLEKLSSNWIRKYSKQARERSEKLFSWEAVRPMFLAMYGEVFGETED